MLSAVHRAGFVPDDATHLGYFRSIANSGLPEIIPYEWMTAANPTAHRAENRPAEPTTMTAANPTAPGSSDGQVKPTATLVLWLDDSAFQPCFRQRLTRLVLGILPKCWRYNKPPVQVAVLGPATSDGLVGMLREAKAGAEDACPIGNTPKGLHLDIYPATATAADEQLFKRAGIAQPSISVADYLSNHLCFKLHRDTPDDGALAEALAHELKARLFARAACEVGNGCAAGRQVRE